VTDEKNEKRKAVIRQKTNEYLARAEKIKEIIKQQNDTVGSSDGTARFVFDCSHSLKLKLHN
jgi:hypothetical protein